MNNILARAIGTGLAFVGYYISAAMLAPQMMLITAQSAGQQFDNSDQGFLRAWYVMGFANWAETLLSVGFFIIIVALWWTPIKSWWKIATAPLVALTILMQAAPPAQAYFDKIDHTEVIPIPPNWSAFWIPGFGDTKGAQVQKNDEAFLNDKKVSAKYFIVPHAVLQGSAGNSVFAGYNYVTNTGSLILVDRTRYSREWVDAADRGTSAHKEGFPCQSNEGLNMTAGVSIGTYVTEENAAKFLYNFGVKSEVPYKPTGNIEVDGSRVFQSVQYGRSLNDVMDDVGRKKIQTLVCDQFSTRTLAQGNTDMKVIMDAVTKASNEYFNSVGITLDFIGWGDTISFDSSVQDAINRNYIASQEEAIGKKLQPYSDIIRALAAAQAVRDFGSKTDGHLPNTYVGITPEVMSILSQFSPMKPAAPGK
jgi:hypothetical protein